MIGLSMTFVARATTRTLSPYLAFLYGVKTPVASVIDLTSDVAGLRLFIDTDDKSARTFLICIENAPDTPRRPETTIEYVFCVAKNFKEPHEVA